MKRFHVIASSSCKSSLGQLGSQQRKLKWNHRRGKVLSTNLTGHSAGVVPAAASCRLVASGRGLREQHPRLPEPEEHTCWI